MKKNKRHYLFPQRQRRADARKKQKTNIDRLALYAWNWSHKSQQTRGKPYNVFR